MEGYAKIAERMATLPSLAIFRQFQALRAQNLLYMQAELVELETRFREQASRDSQSQEPNEKLYSRDWLTLSSPDDKGQIGEQWRLALEIRGKLEAYGMRSSFPGLKHSPSNSQWTIETALLRHIKLSSTCEKPRKQALDILTSNLDNPALPDYLLGLDHSVWTDERSKQDLVAVNANPDFDLLTTWLIKVCLGPYHRFIGRRRKKTLNQDADLFHYDDNHLKIPAHIVSTLFASLLPSLSIVVLYVVHDMTKRLGLIAVFTAVFSVTLASLTKARTVDIFAATAA